MNCLRCGRHESEVALSEAGDVCVQCEQSILEQQDAARALDEYEYEQTWGPA